MNKLLALLNALKLTLQQFFTKPITMSYPEEKWDFPARFRGQPVLIKNKKGQHLCVACGLCEKICPCSCIEVTPNTGADGIRTMEHFQINLLRCSFCGLCVEACPVDAIRMGEAYELACGSKHALIIQKDGLLNNYQINGDMSCSNK
ncbi:MAG: NADH-quinone oxidoreductase subunit I [Deltaproteobacteria bacterium HGW-Deltaproteobacteria-10]|nr:MAG: NADH-quinone oxidoreductase subunit I [Deltaproteobacteria bacterium HGW-Deltaproteobacteria-10]